MGFRSEANARRFVPIGPFNRSIDPLFQNPTRMAFGSTGRILFADQGETFVAEPGTQGPQLSRLIASHEFVKTPSGLAIGAGDLIFTSHADGLIRVHFPDGSLVNNAFATPFNPTGWPAQGRQTSLAFAPGGMFGTDLYATTSYVGEILGIDSSGQSTAILSGMGGISAMTFGPDGAMYLSDFVNDRILRVTPNVIPEPSSIVMVSLGAASVVGFRLRRRGRSGNEGEPASRID